MAGHTLPDAIIRTEIKAQIDALSLSGWTVYRSRPGNDASYPYIFISTAADTLMSNKTSWGNNQIYWLHFWDDNSNPNRLESAASAVLEALTDGTFTVSGFNLAGMYMADGGQQYTDPEEEAWTRVLPIRIMTTGASR